MFKMTPLASAIRCVTITGALATAAVPALAATASDSSSGKSAQTMEEVVVTGSRIRTPDFESNAPVATVSSDQFKITGTINTESLMNTLPQTIPGLDKSSNNPGGGFATINLRGLGTQRTLVLVDGTRMVPTVQDGTVDINDIPTALIKRVEVLTGGASAVYGSDAVAGVVNFIMKDNFEGAQLDVGTQESGKGDAAISTASLTIGANSGDGNGNVVMNLSWTQRDGLYASARSYTDYTLAESYDSNGNVTGTYHAGSPGIPQTLLFGGNFPLFNKDGTTRPFVSTGPNNDYYNYAPVNYLQLPQMRYQLSTLGHYKFNQHFELYGRGFMTSSHVPQQLAPTPNYGTYTFTLDGNPFIPTATQKVLSGEFGNGVDTNGDGIDDTATAFIGRRMVESGPRISNDEFLSFQVQMGARGQIAGSWQYDGYVQMGQVHQSETQLGNINKDRFQQGLLLNLTTNPVSCQDPKANGGTVPCTPINMYGAGNISPQAAAFVATAVDAETVFKQNVYALNLNGDLFSLPGGNAGAALGFEHMDENSAFRPSQDLAASTIAGFNGAPPVKGGFHVDSIYGEVRLPFLTGVPMAQELSADLAYRTSHYTTAGTVDSYKVSFSWAPIGQLRFRGGYNTAVRAPSIAELYSPQGENFPKAVDPCSQIGNPTAAVAAICEGTGLTASQVGSAVINAPAGQVRELTGGNPNLHQEKAKTYTLGVVWQPDYIQGLSASVDYYNIKIKDAIASFGGGAANVLSVCYDPTNPAGGIGSDFCNVIHRRPNGQIEYVSILQQNVASIKQAGVDIQATYTTSLLSGTFKVNYLGTFTTKAQETPYKGADPIVCKGKFGNTCGQPTPKYKHRVTLNYSKDNWSGQLLWRMIGSVHDDDPSTNYLAESVPAFSYFDAAGTYQFSNYTFTVGVYNLADKKPPLMGGNAEQDNTFPETYDVFGRTFYVQASAKF